MYVCICNAITDRDIREAARNGVSSMEALGDRLKVATCCGSCRECAREVLHQALSSAPGALAFGG